MERGRLSKSEAERHRETSHANAKVGLELALKSLEEALDWERSWPNNITNLESDLVSLINKLRIIIRQVDPVDTDGHVRVVAPIIAEDKVIVIGDD